MVFVTSLVHNIDPITIIFRQEEMRAHYTQCLEQGKIESFPVKKPPGTKNTITEKYTFIVVLHATEMMVPLYQYGSM